MGVAVGGGSGEKGREQLAHRATTWVVQLASAVGGCVVLASWIFTCVRMCGSGSVKSSARVCACARVYQRVRPYLSMCVCVCVCAGVCLRIGVNVRLFLVILWFDFTRNFVAKCHLV